MSTLPQRAIVTSTSARHTARSRSARQARPAHATLDLLGAARPAPGDTATPHDFGALEYGAVVDRIFVDPFDVGGYPARSPQD